MRRLWMESTALARIGPLSSNPTPNQHRVGFVLTPLIVIVRSRHPVRATRCSRVSHRLYELLVDFVRQMYMSSSAATSTSPAIPHAYKLPGWIARLIHESTSSCEVVIAFSQSFGAHFPGVAPWSARSRFGATHHLTLPDN